MDFFEILPLPSNDYFDPILTGKYKPLFDIVLEKTKGKEKLLPTNTGGHTNLKNAIIARGGKDFVDLFKDKQLEDLFQRKDIQWLDSGIYDKYRNDKKIWSFFTDEKYLGIAVHRPEDLPKILAKKFLENQDEDWMIGLYSFLLDKKDYSDKLKETPYIRISVPKTEISKRGEIDHVKPSEAYLPIENIDLTHLNANLPIVKTTIAQDPQAKQFLEQIKLTPPDEFAIISQHLQQYSTSPLTITEERNKQSIKLIAKFLKDKRKEQQCEDKLDDLKRQMKGISFFYARNCEEKRELKKPQEIYIPHPYSEDTDLEQFFEKNTNIWFLDSMYAGIPNFTEFWKFLEISTKPKIIKNDFEYHKFQDGFRQDYKLDGLDFFFKNQTMTLKKSLYLWRLLLESQKDSQYKIEFSGYLKYARYKYEKEHGYLGDHAGIVHKNTTILNLLTQHAWIPNKQSEFECPSKVKEFHDDFERLSNEFKDEAEKLFRVLEISSASLNLMEQLRSQIPENEFKKIMLVRETPIEYLEEANRKYQETQKQTETIPEQSAKHFEPRKGIREFFNRPQRRVSTDTPVDAGVVSNPERRREKTAEEIQQACENEPPVSDRFSFSLVKKWDVKNPDTRKFLQHEYGGKCQICESSFKKRGDGEPYFEGVYMNPHIKAASLDRHGNVLCLCPTCRAKILIGSVCVEEDIIQQILDHKLQNEGGIRNFEIPIILCGEERKIEFSEKHILDLQEILRADQSTGLD